MTLAPTDFDAYFSAVHGYTPFPWQKRLASLVFERGWPDALDVPTGAGKTAAIDIAVFHLALEASWGPSRSAAVRIAFVVDRRLVVDDARERARTIAEKLSEAQTGVLAMVADALRPLAENRTRPLAVATLRGGAPREPDWVRTPNQPLVILSTVDQVGSRFLFRGYGVRETMWPIHAGLLGADTLYLLDEAHLSQPFVETVKACRDHQPRALGGPGAVVTLSATQAEAAAVTDLLRVDDARHPVLGPRLRAGKPTELCLVRDSSLLLAALAEKAWNLSVTGGGSAVVVAVVANRVARARQVFELLFRRSEGNDSVADVALLTGRSRPIDRHDALETLLPRMTAQRTTASEKPLFIVATQCVEAGADLDFDALVTEIAPLDSLTQRFGRLNRMGRDIAARAVIVAAASDVGARAEADPLYGSALAATWAWLGEHATKAKGEVVGCIDFGIEASRNWLPAGADLDACIAPRAHAPVLLPAFVQSWTFTSPPPNADPEVALFLHGPRSGPADVQVMWRADLTMEKEDADIELLGACPPSALEALPLPVHEVKRWLQGEAGGDVSDLELSPEEELDSAEGGQQILRWRGVDDPDTRHISVDEVRPGDLLVVSAFRGGCDRWGWSPASKESVPDRGSDANRLQRGRDILRLSAALLGTAAGESPGAVLPRWQRLMSALADATDDEVCAGILSFRGLPESYSAWVLEAKRGIRILRRRSGEPIALERRTSGRDLRDGGGAASTEDDSSSVSLRAVTLVEHSQGVANVAEAFAKQAGLPEALVQDIRVAAFLHDAGKAHPAFRCWLYGGDELAALSGPALAKSGRVRLGSDARRRAGLPPGARHEVASLAFACAHPLLDEAHEPELVLWLIGTHHGWGRPFFPAPAWPLPNATFSADLGDGERKSVPAPEGGALLARWVELYRHLLRRYGPWGLARLEAIVRLADHRQSESEQEDVT